MRALPIIAFDGPEPHGAGHDAGIECIETIIDTDEVTVAAGIQEGSDSGRPQAVVAAKCHGGLAIEPYQSFSGAEPDESAPVASNALQLVPRQAVGGREGAHRQALRGQRRRGGEGDHARDDRRPEAEDCRHCFITSGERCRVSSRAAGYPVSMMTIRRNVTVPGFACQWLPYDPCRSLRVAVATVCPEGWSEGHERPSAS